MYTAQRNKTGCWTCRLRRKKCSEGGNPCSNCESRGVFCHGYGPKPPWKDRGEKERAEANRLKLQSRTRPCHSAATHSISSQQSSTSGTSIEETTPGIHSPLQIDLPLCSPSPSLECPAVEFWDNQELSHGIWDTPDLSNDLWTNSSSVETLVGFADLQPAVRNLLPGPALSFPSVTSTHTAQAVQGLDMGERELELVMLFIGETFALQHQPYRNESTMQRSWLLFLLVRSPTFYYASLSTSAYHYFLTLSGDSEARGIAFQDYQKYRACALRSFCELLKSDWPLLSSSDSRGLLGECMICGVQIAILEALSRNMQDCQSHLSSAAQSFLKNEELMSEIRAPRSRTSSVSSQLIPSTVSSAVALPQLSPMESKALSFFRAILVWNDILSCSTQKIAPLGAESYRKLLADEDFAQTFRNIIGCESWILVAIMDATMLEIWKRDQEAQGNLSIRELVSRAEKIESVLEQAIEKLSTLLSSKVPIADITCYQNDNSDNVYHVQTYIFAHSILIHLHTIVSGPWPGVPEIQQSVDRTILAWKIRPCSINLKTLAWPYCVGASLAVGAQRDIFRELMSESCPKEPTLGNLLHLKSVVEECWKGFDGRASDRDASCDWKNVMQRLNLSILFV